MNREGIQRFLRALGADMDTLVDSGRGWLNCACPLAPYLHSSGEDEHPSFGVSISDDGWSVYYCFACSDEAKPLSWLLHNIWLMSGKYPWEAAREYIRWEVHESEKKKPVVPDVWVAPKPRRLTPLPGKVLRKFPLLQGAKGFEARRCRDFLEQRGIPGYIQNFCGLRYFEEMQALAFPLTDINGNIYVLRVRRRKKKWIRTVSPKMVGFPWMRFPSLKKDVGAWFGMHLVDWSRPVMLVEGEGDCLRLLSLGYFNVIASATSSVTDRQINALTADTLILGYDADAAGEHACRRIVDMVEGRATLLKADWSLAEKEPGIACKDAGDLPSEEQLQVVLSSLENIS